jgi:GTP-binding protein HflX
MSGSDVLTENKLFATLDTSTRKTHIPGAGEIVISDTVGFLRKLPHDLVASFRSTLEVLLDSDLLLIIMDASSKWYSQQMDTVKSVIKELGANERPFMIIFNKTDLVEDNLEMIKSIETDFPEAVFTSSFSTDAINELKEKIGEHIVKVKRESQQEQFLMDNIESEIEIG